MVTYGFITYFHILLDMSAEKNGSIVSWSKKRMWFAWILQRTFWGLSTRCLQDGHNTMFWRTGESENKVTLQYFNLNDWFNKKFPSCFITIVIHAIIIVIQNLKPTCLAVHARHWFPPCDDLNSGRKCSVLALGSSYLLLGIRDWVEF